MRTINIASVPRWGRRRLDWRPCSSRCLSAMIEPCPSHLGTGPAPMLSHGCLSHCESTRNNQATVTQPKQPSTLESRLRIRARVNGGPTSFGSPETRHAISVRRGPPADSLAPRELRLENLTMQAQGPGNERMNTSTSTRRYLSNPSARTANRLQGPFHHPTNPLLQPPGGSDRPKQDPGPVWTSGRRPETRT